MASRADELHSHQFTARRVIAALALRDADPVHARTRRGGAALIASLLVAAAALAAVGVYGVLRPGGDPSWRDASSVIVERESGARFVFRDGVLYPVLNYSSALLIVGADTPSTTLVSSSSLDGVARGAVLGIDGAPDLLPGAEDLVTEAWILCSRPPSAGLPTGVESVLRVGSPASSSPDSPQPLGERGVLAADPGGGLHLIWRGRRHAIVDADVVLAAFAWSRESAMAVAPATLNALPPGVPLRRLALPGLGQSSTVDGFRAGEVVVVHNQSGGRQFGVVRADGLADITQVQAGLLLADGANGLRGVATALSQARYAAAPRAASLVPTGEGAPPAATPERLATSARQGLCASFADGQPVPQIGVVAAVPAMVGEIRAAPALGDAPAVVDWVAVPPGRGAIVMASAGSRSAEGALAFVSDQGVRFPVASGEVLRTLGYPADVVRAQRLPAALVALLPAGPALDPAAANRPPADP